MHLLRIDKHSILLPVYLPKKKGGATKVRKRKKM